MGIALAGLLPAIGKLVRTVPGDTSSGTLLGWLQSAQFAGQVAGLLVAGQVGAHIGLSHVFYVTSALLMVGRWWSAQVYQRQGELTRGHQIDGLAVGSRSR